MTETRWVFDTWMKEPISYECYEDVHDYGNFIEGDDGWEWFSPFKIFRIKETRQILFNSYESYEACIIAKLETSLDTAKTASEYRKYLVGLLMEG